MKRRQIVPLEQVSPDQQNLVTNCLYCSCPKHPKSVKAVAAVEVEMAYSHNLYFGICGNHAEVYPLTEEEKKHKPMVCIQCFPR